MSADLTPAEQSRAAQWAAEWLRGCGHGDAGYALSKFARTVDPPETVESLRAELAAVTERTERESHSLAVELDAMRDKRDSARQDARGWESSASYLHDRLTEVKAERDEACRKVLELRTCWEPAEDAQPQRQPRVWYVGGLQPNDADEVRDRRGYVWERDSTMWRLSGLDEEPLRTWLYLTREYGPLTEVKA